MTSNNPNGRPKGSKNKKTKEWETLRETLLSQHTERFIHLLDKMDDDQFVRTYLKLLEYFRPKIARIQPENDNNEPAIKTLVIVPASKRDRIIQDKL